MGKMNNIEPAFWEASSGGGLPVDTAESPTCLVPSGSQQRIWMCLQQAPVQFHSEPHLHVCSGDQMSEM